MAVATVSGHVLASSEGSLPFAQSPGGLGIIEIYARSKENERTVVVSLEFYFDESGKEQRSRFVLLAGVAARAGQWKAFEKDWSACCAEPPSIEYFKMTEAANLKCQFAESKGWTEESAEAKVSKLTDVLKTYALYAFASRCHKGDYAKAKGLAKCIVPREFDYHYLPCFWDSMRGVALYMNGKNKQAYSRPKIVLDSQPECDVVAHMLFDQLKAQARNRESPFYEQAKWLGSIAFEDDKLVLPLQAADLVAWHWNRAIKDIIDNRPAEPVFTRLQSIPFNGTDWSVATLIDWRRAMEYLAQKR